MENKQFENDNFVLYAPDSLSHVYENLESNLNDTLELYKKLFEVDSFRKVQINYFDNKDDFREFVSKIRGDDSLPKYAVGTSSGGMISAYIDPSIKETDDIFNKRLHLAQHELFHIMYHELIVENNRKDYLTWFDEGCAQFFSGEKEYELNEGFNEWFNKVKSETNSIPKLNDLSHGDSFKTDDYNGYDLSLLAVKNLYDRLGFDEFKYLLTNGSRVKEYGDNLLDELFLFYGMLYRVR